MLLTFLRMTQYIKSQQYKYPNCGGPNQTWFKSDCCDIFACQNHVIVFFLSSALLIFKVKMRILCDTKNRS